jgi:hypothetical protein
VQRLAFELAASLLLDSEPAADLLMALPFAASKSIAPNQDLSMALGQQPQERLQLAGRLVLACDVGGVSALGVAEQVPQLRSVIADRLVE